jgi:hypothetical protein
MLRIRFALASGIPSPKVNAARSIDYNPRQVDLHLPQGQELNQTQGLGVPTAFSVTLIGS